MNILIVGLGSIALKHISAIKEILPEAVFYALRSGISSQEIEGVTSIQNVSQLPLKPDLIIISSPTFSHAHDIIKCLIFDCPLFIEKPLFHQWGQEEIEIYDQIVKSELITYVACNFRFHPAIQHLKNTLSTSGKRINEINIYCGSYLPEWRPNRNFREIYSSIDSMGGGVHLDLIHELDYVYWFFGKPSKIFSFKKSSSSLDINSNDFASFTLDYDTFAVNIILNYYRVDKKRSCEILFEDDTWNCDLLKCEIMDDKGNVIFKKEDFNVTDTYVDQIKYLKSQIINGTKPMNNITEALEVLKIALHGEIR